jgi:integrase
VTKHFQLTDPSVKNRNKAPGRYLDGHGLYLQVADGGSRSWIFRYTLAKKTREMGLGSVDDFSLAEARERIKRYRQLVADGIDPIDHRQQERATRTLEAAAKLKNSMTFQQCAEEFHRLNADSWRNAKHADQWINTMKTYVFPKFGDVPVGDVTREHLRLALFPIWKTKAETASRVLERMHKVIDYAAGMGYGNGLDSEEWRHLKASLPDNKKQRRVVHHASCPHTDVGTLLDDVRTGPATAMVKLAFEFTVLTAARSGEVRGALWSEIDEVQRRWTIPPERMKGGREHIVPLTGRMLAILAEAKQLQTLPTMPLVFPNPKGVPFSDMVFTQGLRRMDLDYTMHGFRASFRTWGGDIAHYPREMLEVALSHAVGDSTEQAYNRSDMLDKRRGLMESWAAYLQGPNEQTPT